MTYVGDVVMPGNMGNNVHFSSMRLDWRTPTTFYEVLNKEFKFDLDPCAAKGHELAPHNFYENDGLKVKWFGVVFMNPPYGRKIMKWLAKAYAEVKYGHCKVVALIPSRTDTAWWHDIVMQATEIRFIRGRLCFDDGQYPAPFPSCVVVFDGR